VIVHGTASQDLKHKQPGNGYEIQFPAVFLISFYWTAEWYLQRLCEEDMASGRQDNDHCRALIAL
jgi:hypothetical protein